ncbi:myosin I [Chamberlinius hualienensis]
MTYQELYTKGARLWIPDPVTVWKGAEVVSDFKGQDLVVEFEDGEEGKKKLTLTIKNPQELPPLRNPDILIGENDLTSLSYLNEPEVLYNLQVRFGHHNAIYTYCGIVLVAINPYEELPIYGNDTILAYRGQSMGDLDPHIFAVAEEAYTKVEREDQNQSIIVSGESGAGKTVSAKYAMRYFATVGGSTKETQVEKKVLASNPIMEAIGNAKTTRNDNSSRFGKYIEIDFNKQYNIVGANMRTYLLEKSRVVFQASDERNYHIFYQLCASSDLLELAELRLTSAELFRYTQMGESPTINGINDAQNFVETRNALTLLGFSKTDQMMMFRILAAILHMGNLHIVEEVVEGDDEGSVISSSDPHLKAVAELLGIDKEQLRMWLCNRKIVSMREIFTKPMSVVQASFSRDALAKHIYAQLFKWIVELINKTLASPAKIHKFIGVLDIYGFETFEINSFEQFCINYANEKLQQQFNQHVFKLEQDEYVREKIEWKFIDFYDNQPCIDLIENKIGILDLLDEECKMPKGSDITWVQKLYDKCKTSKHFEKPRLSNCAFMVCHFADKVQYESSGFLEKNRDTVMDEHLNILKASQYVLVAELFLDESEKKSLKPVPAKRVSVTTQSSTASVQTQKQHKKTVGSQFRDSLSLLMSTLNSTTPHYVRCIKPNDGKESFSFDPKRAVQQLRACGVLETIRISAAGFPSRWSYQDFFNRYRVLMISKDIKRNDLKSTCEKILHNLIKDEDKFQFGKTKIFFRAGQVAYLEKLRSDKLKACGIMIQKYVRGWIQRRRYKQLRTSVINFQRFARGYLARRKANFLRRTRAAICIQRHIRGFLQRRKYRRIRISVLLIQCRARGTWARQRYDQLRRVRAAIIIQKHVRGWLARKQYQHTRSSIILLQSCVRRLIAKRVLKTLKVEARSVEHVKKLNVGLENKIITMQQKIEELNKENHLMKAKESNIQDMQAKLEKMKAMEAATKGYSNKISELEAEIQKLLSALGREREEKQDIISEKDLLEKRHKEMEAKLNAENNRLNEEFQIIQQQLLERGENMEGQVKAIVENEKLQILREFDDEKTAYQKLMREHSTLEQRCENLQTELTLLRTTGALHTRTPSNVSTISISPSDAAEINKDGEMQLSMSDFQDDDVGYDSVRSSAASIRPKVETVNWDVVTSSSDTIDVTLVLKLQQKLKEVEMRNALLEKKLEAIDSRDDDSPKDDIMRTQDLIRLQELEMEIAKLKDSNAKLRQSLSGNTGENELLNQFTTLQDELERRRDECIQLRTILANKSQDMKRVASDSYGGEVDIINEDGELLMAFETQKKLIRQLETELQSEKKKYSKMESEFNYEMKKLKEDNERQQKLISQVNLQKTPQAQTEAIMQHEITRLTSENLDLREKIDILQEQNRKLKKQLKICAKKLKESGAGGIEQVTAEAADSHKDVSVIMPEVKHKEADELGMFEYRKEDEPPLLKTLIFELKPRVAVTMLPGLPAYILFMCIRHTDYINDDEKVRSLLTNTITGIKKVVKKRHEDLEVITMWLSNTCRLLHNLKQYSGDKAFQFNNTPKQNEQCLRNFDLSEYRQVLSDVAVWINQGVIKIMEEKVQQLIVPAVLEHEAIPGISGKPSGLRGRSSSFALEQDSPVDPQRALDMMLRELNAFYNILSVHGVDPELVSLIFKQILYFICAGALNNLLLRKDMCHWSKGMQIRYNLSHIEQWCRDHKLQDQGVTEPLQPIIQASQLLQARKTDDDVNSICEMCDKLSIAQIIKILNLYTPADAFEERVPMTFIRKIQAKLIEREESQDRSNMLLMDTKFAYPVRFPFSPSCIELENITIPDQLYLPMLKKV